MVTRARGTAKPVRTARMAVATISSISVKPEALGLRTRFKTTRLIGNDRRKQPGPSESFSHPVFLSTAQLTPRHQNRPPNSLLHRHSGHRSGHGNGLHTGIFGPPLRDGKGGLAAAFCHEG